MYGMFQTAFGVSGMNRASVFEWHKRFKEATESVRDDKRCRRSKEVNTPKLIGQYFRVRVTILRVLREVRKRFHQKRPTLFKSGQWYFLQDNTPVHNSILVTDYLSKMGIKTVPYPPYSPDLAPWDFGYSLSSEAVIMRQLRRWKRLWRRSLTHSHKRTPMGPSRSCWNGPISALQSEDITSKGSRVSNVYYQ